MSTWASQSVGVTEGLPQGFPSSAIITGQCSGPTSSVAAQKELCGAPSSHGPPHLTHSRWIFLALCGVGVCHHLVLIR